MEKVKVPATMITVISSSQRIYCNQHITKDSGGYGMTKYTSVYYNNVRSVMTVTV